jgi:hypothetical protein
VFSLRGGVLVHQGGVLIMYEPRPTQRNGGMLAGEAASFVHEVPGPQGAHKP